MNVAFLGEQADELLAAQHQSVGFHVARLVRLLPALGEVDLHGEARSDGAGDLVLQVEQLLDIDLELIGPESRSRFRHRSTRR